MKLYDFEARQMDPAIARFTSMDPMAEKYYSVSPYTYCGNNPVNYVDPTGKEWYSYAGENGALLYGWDINIKSQKDLDAKMSNANFIGKTYADGSTYYSLFGDTYDISSKEGKAVQKMDEALINYWDYTDKNLKAKVDMFGNTINEPVHKTTNFDIGEYSEKSKMD